MAETKNPNLRARLVLILLSQLACEESDVTEEAKLQDLGADELDVVEIQIAAEGEFDIEISDEEIDKAGGYEGITFGKLLEIVEKEVARKTA